MEHHYDILVIGRDYQAEVFAAYLPKENSAVLISTEEVFSSPNEKVSYLGNGEFPDTAEKIFGPKLKDLFWELSQKNQTEILRLSPSLSLEAEPAKTCWQKEKKEEPAVKFRADKISTTNAIKTAGPLKIAGDAWGIIVTAKNLTIKAKMVFLVDDYLAVQTFSYLRDKCIPVTLPVYAQNISEPPKSCELELFNAGSDYTFRGKTLRYFGSYRNLFEDKAVGLISGSDPVSEKNIRQFFGDKGYLDTAKDLKCFSLLESITCDGLPIIGSLPYLPNLQVCIGFAGRPQNFIFEVARRMAQGILGHGLIEGLEPFSIKRF